MCENRKDYIEFCCMGHEAYFTEDFFSDEDDGSFNYPASSDCNVKFMPEPYEDLQIDILKAKYHEEVGVQCENKTPLFLSQLSSMPAYSRNSKDKVLIPNLVKFSITHTAKVFLPVTLEQFQCKQCAATFKTGQALGGHMSKKH